MRAFTRFEIIFIALSFLASALGGSLENACSLACNWTKFELCLHLSSVAGSSQVWMPIANSRMSMATGVIYDLSPRTPWWIPRYTFAEASFEIHWMSLIEDWASFRVEKKKLRDRGSSVQCMLPSLAPVLLQVKWSTVAPQPLAYHHHSFILVVAVLRTIIQA